MIKESDRMFKELRNRVRGGKGSIELVHIFDGHELTGKAKICAKLVINPDCSVGKHVHENENVTFYYPVILLYTFSDKLKSPSYCQPTGSWILITVTGLIPLNYNTSYLPLMTLSSLSI